MSPQTLAQIDPAQVRVKLSVPAGFALDVAASRLTLKLAGPAGTRTGAMALALLNVTHGVRSGGWFGHDVPVTTYRLALNRAGVEQFRELQQFLLTSHPETFEFSVKAPFAETPRDVTSVEFWADLKLRRDEPFLPLVDGARIKFPHRGTSR